MKLEALFRGIPVLDSVHWDPERKVNKITSDSRAIEEGDLFVACAGARMDGHDFIQQSVVAGATVVVYQKELEVPIPRHIVGIRVADTRECLALLLAQYYHHPDQKIKLVGVTGTNGKTTVAYMLYRLLSSKVKCGYIGTLGYDFPGQNMVAANTTPGIETLLPVLSQMKHEGVQYCFVEVSSHALDQRRVFGLQFELVLFTQLTQDHLDYHHTMERYFQAKRLLFAQHPLPKKILINRDCVYARRLLDENLHAKSFSLDRSADYRGSEVTSVIGGSQFTFETGGRKHVFGIHLPMRHNVSNTVAVLSALDLLGFHVDHFKNVLENFAGVPGRLERLSTADGYEIFVDYAHTPDAFERVLSGAKDLHPKRILTLFGCGGDRDQEKRPLMASVAAQYSNIVVLTSDNPRSEDPDKILRDIRRGIPHAKSGSPLVLEIPDRREAIEKILSLAESGDVVLVLGKGHEDYQILGDKKIPFDDRLVIQECLKGKIRVLSS